MKVKLNRMRDLGKTAAQIDAGKYDLHVRHDHTGSWLVYRLKNKVRA